LSLGPDYSAQTRWTSSFGLRNALADWKSKEVRQKREPATSAILMTVSTSRPERLAEILREIITLSGTKGARPQIESANVVGTTNTPASEVANQALVEAQSDNRIDFESAACREIASREGG